MRTLYRPGAIKELEDVLKKSKADITAIQEMRWIGEGIQKRRSCDVYFSCHEKHHLLGCGFVVGAKLRDHVIRWNPINERLCTIRVKGRFFNVSLICAHAPTEDADEIVKDNFYYKLDEAYNNCPKHDIKIMIGDFNAKVGKENIFKGAIGSYSLHDNTNGNGMRLIDLATERNMVISSTKFPHRRIHTATWVSPDRMTTNQIDHVLIDARHSSDIMDVRSFRGPNIDSDHFLVAARFRARLSNSKKHRRTTTRRTNVDALKSERTAIEFAEVVSRNLDSMLPGESVEEKWISCAQTIKNAAESVLGSAPPPVREEWFDEECRQAIEAKNCARLQCTQRHNTRRSWDEYSRKRRIATRLLRKKKRALKNRNLSDIENHCGRNEVRKFYQTVKRQRDGYKPQNIFVKDKTGNLITESQGITARWVEHFSELLNTDNDGENPLREAPNNNNTPVNPAREPPPTLAEVELAIKRLKNNKAAGSDCIPAELIKAGGPVLLERLHGLMESIWLEETMPTEWNLAVICPIHKKGDKQECTNYRGISLLNAAYKILSSILCERMKPYMASNIGSYQCGYRPGKSTTDQMFILRRLLERTLEFQIDTHHLFIDFKKAYDSIQREELFSAMSDFGIPAKLISLSRMTLNNIKCAIKTSGDPSATFETKIGFRQGDALSCDFFNICLEKIVRSSGVGTRGTIFNKSAQLLAYADDIDIIGRNQRSVSEVFVRIEEAAGKMGLRINEDKTKYMISSKNEARHRQLGQNVTIGNYNFEVVKEFVYLGGVVDSNNNMSLEVKRRIMLANRAFFSLSHTMRSKIISRKTKIVLYKTLILPILMYGSESWTMNANEETILGSFERKILRKIFGPVCHDGEWRIRYNHELYQLYHDIDLVKKIKVQRLRWLGHVERMDDSAPQKRVALGPPPDGRRKQGRPPLRWMDDVEHDINQLGLRNWRAKARNRESWKDVLKEARILL